MKKARTSHKGRKCKFLHCKQILSIYNHDAYCYVHHGQSILEHKQKVSKA